MIGIIGAMQKELNYLLSLLTDKETKEIYGFSFYQGKLKNKEVVIVKCGIGKVNASIVTSLLINNFHPSFIINTGVAGGVDANPYDIVVGTKFIYNDFSMKHIDGTETGVCPGLPLYLTSTDSLVNKAKEIFKDEVKYGLITTGDRFQISKKDISDILIHNPLAVDCESTSIAHTCYLLKTDFIIIRGISDKLDHQGQINDYNSFAETVAEKCSNFILKMIE